MCLHLDLPLGQAWKFQSQDYCLTRIEVGGALRMAGVGAAFFPREGRDSFFLFDLVYSFEPIPFCCVVLFLSIYGCTPDTSQYCMLNAA